MDALLLARVLRFRSRLRGHERWSRERLLDEQARALDELRKYAVQRSPFYRELHKGLERAPLAELPIVTKHMLMTRFDEVVLDNHVRDALLRAGVRSDIALRIEAVADIPVGPAGKRPRFVRSGAG